MNSKKVDKFQKISLRCLKNITLPISKRIIFVCSIPIICNSRNLDRTLKTKKIKTQYPKRYPMLSSIKLIQFAVLFVSSKRSNRKKIFYIQHKNNF